MNEDLYKILEVNKDASQDDIKKSYRKLSKQYHPDLNQNNKEAEEKFKKINEAYSVLSDPNKRQQYDSRGSGFGNFGGFGGFGGNAGGFDFFSDFFNFNNNNNNRNRSNQNIRGSDLRIKLNFSLEEIINGSIKNIKYNRNVCCKTCNGNGSKNGSSFQQCNNCGGHGSVVQNIQTPFGRIQTSNACNVCNGKGKLINEICEVCASRGIKENLESIEISIPPGISDGFVYKIEHGGNYSNSVNSIPGDLIIICQIAEHNIYKRFNLDLHRDVFINFIDAIAGNDNFILNLFGEEIKIKIEPNTDNGRILRLRGKGLPSNNGVGDLYIHLNVFVPKNLNSETINYISKIKNEIEPNLEEINPEIGFLNKSLKINSLYNN